MINSKNIMERFFSINHNKCDMLYQPLLTERLDAILKEQESKMDPCSKLWFSRYGNIESPIDSILSQIYMTDFLIFNHYKITEDEIPLLLSMILFSGDKDLEDYHLDGWHIYDESQGYNFKPCIELNEKESDQFIDTLYEMFIATRAMLWLMRSVGKDRVNMHNFNMIQNWNLKYESPIYCMHNYRNNLKYEKQHVPETVVILKGILTKDVFETKFDKFVGSLNYNIKNSQDHDYHNYMEYISDYKVDLSKCIQIAPKRNINCFVININRYDDNTLNCGSIPIEDTLCRLVNGALKNKVLEKSEALEELKKGSYYFDYLKYVRMKMDFKSYPIINVERFNREHGYRRAQDIIYNDKVNV